MHFQLLIFNIPKTAAVSSNMDNHQSTIWNEIHFFPPNFMPKKFLIPVNILRHHQTSSPVHFSPARRNLRVHISFFPEFRILMHVFIILPHCVFVNFYWAKVFYAFFPYKLLFGLFWRSIPAVYIDCKRAFSYIFLLKYEI